MTNKKNATRTLRLARETVRTLSAADLARAGGGSGIGCNGFVIGDLTNASVGPRRF